VRTSAGRCRRALWRVGPDRSIGFAREVRCAIVGPARPSCIPYPGQRGQSRRSEPIRHVDKAFAANAPRLRRLDRGLNHEPFKVIYSPSIVVSFVSSSFCFQNDAAGHLPRMPVCCWLRALAKQGPGLNLPELSSCIASCRPRQSQRELQLTTSLPYRGLQIGLQSDGDANSKRRRASPVLSDWLQVRWQEYHAAPQNNGDPRVTAP